MIIQVIEAKFVGRWFTFTSARCTAMAAVVGVCPFATLDLHAEQPAGASTIASSAVHALAHLEPQSGLVMVGARPGARILKIAVAEGDVVKAGTLLATLEGNEQAQSQLALAVAQKKRALEQRSRARQKAALERKQLDATLALQRPALVTQVDTLKKKNAAAQGLYTGLSALGGVAKLPPKDQIELEAGLYLLQTQSIKTELELNELDIKKGLLADQRKLEDQQLGDGGSEDDLLDRQIDVAKAALDQTLVLSPSPGTILSLGAHAGEIGTGQILTMGDLSSVVAQAEVDQSDLAKLRVGDTARVRINEETAVGKVTRIGSLVGFNRMRSVDPRAVQDVRVVRVTIQLDKAEPASRFIGMQVDVSIVPASNPPSDAGDRADRPPTR